MINWIPRSLGDMKDYEGVAVLLVTEDARFQGGLIRVTDKEVFIEIGEGHIVAISKAELEDASFFIASQPNG